MNSINIFFIIFNLFYNIKQKKCDVNHRYNCHKFNCHGDDGFSTVNFGNKHKGSCCIEPNDGYDLSNV